MKEEIEIKLFDLLESKDYHELDSQEHQFVEMHSSKEEYESQRMAILGMKDYQESSVPHPLVIDRKSLLLPLIWTSISSAAAAIVLLLWLLPESKRSIQIKWVTPEVRTVDTLVVERVVRDTIVQFQEVKSKIASRDLSPKAIESIPQFEQDAFIADALKIQKLDLENKGVSATNDAVIQRFTPAPFIGM